MSTHVLRLLSASLVLLAAHARSQETAPSPDGMVIGHGTARYRVDMKWAKADPTVAPVINSHALAEGRDEDARALLEEYMGRGFSADVERSVARVQLIALR